MNPINSLLGDIMNDPSEQPGPVQGTGGGLADFVPASVEGEPAALSEGEFVFPADVVSFMGNGSSDAGSRVLNQIVTQVRGMMKQGGEKQSPPLSELVSKAVSKKAP